MDKPNSEKKQSGRQIFAAMGKADTPTPKAIVGADGSLTPDATKMAEAYRVAFREVYCLYGQGVTPPDCRKSRARCTATINHMRAPFAAPPVTGEGLRNIIQRRKAYAAGGPDQTTTAEAKLWDANIWAALAIILNRVKAGAAAHCPFIRLCGMGCKMDLNPPGPL
jgi:hypothetical protein